MPKKKSIPAAEISLPSSETAVVIEMNGFTRIPNQLLDALIRSDLTSIQKSLCFYLIRRTYGWNRREDAISLSDFAAACGCSYSHASKRLKDLIRRNIIRRVKHQPGKITVYALEENISLWQTSTPVSATPVSCSSIAPVSYSSIAPVSYSSIVPVNQSTRVEPLADSADSELQTDLKTVKDNTKDIIKDTNSIVSSDSLSSKPTEISKAKMKNPDDPVIYLVHLLYRCIQEHLPGFKAPDFKNWSQDMLHLLEQDQRDPTEVEAVIRFAHQDDFWQSNILSVNKLRKQYDTLNAKRLQGIKAAQSNRPAPVEYEKFYY